MRKSPDGPARHYIRTSHYADTQLDRTLVAVARLQQAATRGRGPRSNRSRSVAQRTRRGPRNRDIARAIKLIGDGLYYNAMSSALGGQRTRTEVDEGLLAVIDRLIEQGAQAPRA